MDKIAAIRTFLVAADARSFVEAGRRLGLSASAVGKAVGRLEERLGGRLLQRNTQGVALTHEGAAFLERARLVLDELDAAEQELRSSGIGRSGAMPAQLHGQLKIGLPAWVLYLLPAFASFAAAHPAVTLELDFSDTEVDIVGGGYDLVLRAGDLPDSTLRGRVLAHFRHVLVASPDYLAAHGVPESAKDLPKHLLIRRRSLRTGKLDQWPLRNAGGVTLPASAIVRSVQARIGFALAGQGITRVPEPAARELLASGALVSLLDRDISEGGKLTLLWPEQRSGAAAVRALIDHLIIATAE